MMNWTTVITPNTTVTTTTEPHNVTIPNDYPVPVIITSATSCILSIIGALIIFGTYVRIPSIRSFTRRLIVCLTVADLLTCTGYLISVIRYAITNKDVDSVSCVIQSMITTYSTLVSFFLTVFIAYHMFVLVIVQHGQASSTKTLVIYNLISWIIPAIIIGIAMSQKALGADYNFYSTTGPWCWVNTTHRHSFFWMIFTGKGWEILCYMLTTSLYVLLKLYVCLQRDRAGFSEINPQLRNEEKNVLYVWFLLYVFRIWGTARFFMSAMKSDESTVYHVLLYLQAAGDPSQAFVNSLLFCVFDKSVRLYICNKEQMNGIEQGEVTATERTTLIRNENEVGVPKISINNVYGTGTSNPTSTWSASASSELGHMADTRSIEIYP